MALLVGCPGGNDNGEFCSVWFARYMETMMGLRFTDHALMDGSNFYFRSTAEQAGEAVVETSYPDCLVLKGN